VIDRRTFLAGAGGTVLAAPLAAEGQQPSRVAVIGVLNPGSVNPSSPMLTAFRQGLRELGWVDGQNIRLEQRYAEWKSERLSSLAAELVRLRPHVIFTWTQPAAIAAKQATSVIPIVVGAATDLVAMGVAESLARPGGNLTGMSMLGSEAEAKRLQLLKEGVPSVSRVALLVDPALSSEKDYPIAFADAARQLGVQLLRFDAQTPTDIDRVMSAVRQARADALLMVDSAMLNTNQERIGELAIQYRLPAISRSIGFAQAGGLFQYGENPREMARRAAAHVDKILKGAKPADLPIEQPAKFELVINLKTAKALGLTIPPSLLGRADEIIQ
jgi:putative ABC transport system substrate-binding protein